MNTIGITEELYNGDAYIREFEAKVISCEKTDKGVAVVLDKTAFFPEGGGQASDTGVLNVGTTVVDVKDVQIVDGRILHYVSEEIKEGSSVNGKINWMARYRRMQKHSAEHLLCGIIHDKWGYENVGFHLSDEAVIFDVDGELTAEDVAYIERKANEIVAENVSIIISYPEASWLNELNYRSKLELTDGVRLVTIEGYDVCACCAPHVKSTAEIGIIKIIDYMPHRGGMRFTMTAGLEAYEDYAVLDKNNKSIMAVVSSKRHDTGAFVEALGERCKALSIENSALKKTIGELYLKGIMEELEKRENDDSPFMIFSDALDDVQMRNIINECKTKTSGLIAGFMGKDKDGYRYIIATSGEHDLPALAKEINGKLEGRGGGSKQMIQGSVKAREDTIREVIIGC